MWFSFINLYYLKIEIFFFFLINWSIALYLVEKIIFKQKLNIFFIEFIICMLIISIIISTYYFIDIPTNLYFFNNYFICNNFILMLKKLMTSILIIYLIAICNFNEIKKIPIFEYILFILIIFWALLIILISNNLFIIFLFLELVNLSIYCLIGINKNSNWSVEIAFKYFMQSALVTLLAFLGLSLIYISEGTLFINELSLLSQSGGLSYISIISIYFIIISIFFKLGMYPMHSWLPEIYQGSLLITVMFIALIPKVVYFYIFLKIYIEFKIILNSFVYLIGLITIIYGVFITMYQISFKRFIAHGSMIHYGFILLISNNGDILDLAPAFFYLFFHLASTLFISISILYLHDRNNENYIYFTDDISNLYILREKDTILAIFFTSILFSLGGLPITIGFVSKWNLLYNLMIFGYYIEIFILLTTSIISASYYIRLIRFMFFTNEKINKIEYFSNLKYNKFLYYLLVFIFIINIVLILFQESIFLNILNLLICF